MVICFVEVHTKCDLYHTFEKLSKDFQKSLDTLERILYNIRITLRKALRFCVKVINKGNATLV